MRMSIKRALALLLFIVILVILFIYIVFSFNFEIIKKQKAREGQKVEAQLEAQLEENKEGLERLTNSRDAQNSHFKNIYYFLDGGIDVEVNFDAVNDVSFPVQIPFKSILKAVNIAKEKGHDIKIKKSGNDNVLIFWSVDLSKPKSRDAEIDFSVLDISKELRLFEMMTLSADGLGVDSLKENKKGFVFRISGDAKTILLFAYKVNKLTARKILNANILNVEINDFGGVVTVQVFGVENDK